jgi:hypothetical protein
MLWEKVPLGLVSGVKKIPSSFGGSVRGLLKLVSDD